VGNGIDFLGYIVRPHYLLVRQRVLTHLAEKLADHERCVRRADGSLRCPPAQADALQAMLASYFGHMAHARSRNAQAQVLAATRERLANGTATAPQRTLARYIGGLR
jgi:predicted component of type VI protein secretion system